MSNEQKESPDVIWDKLSNDAQQLCVYLGPLMATSGSQDFLEAIAQDFDLKKAMQELRGFDVLEEVTYIQELEETIERLKPTRDLLGIDIKLTDEEEEYLRAKSNLESYQKDPAGHKIWKKPRFRLRNDFKDFVVKLFKGL